MAIAQPLNYSPRKSIMSTNQNLVSEVLAATNRRSFLRKAGLASMVGAVAPALAPLLTPSLAQAAPGLSPETDIAVLNFALNLEYLEAQFYTFAVNGTDIEAQGVSTTAGDGTAPGLIKVKANPKVPFANATVAQYAAEIANDERNHVNFLRNTLGVHAVSQPDLDLQTSFSNLAEMAGLGAGFDPFADDLGFLLGAFIFEDVGVTAYRGGSTLIQNKAYLAAAAGILSVEAFHAAEVRAILYEMAQSTNPAPPIDIVKAVSAISALRDSVDTTASSKDQGITDSNNKANIVPADANGLPYKRSTTQVLRIVYGMTSTGTTVPAPGGFFPVGMNGSFR